MTVLASRGGQCSVFAFFPFFLLAVLPPKSSGNVASPLKHNHTIGSFLITSSVTRLATVSAHASSLPLYTLTYSRAVHSCSPIQFSLHSVLSICDDHQIAQAHITDTSTFLQWAAFLKWANLSALPSILFTFTHQTTYHWVRPYGLAEHEFAFTSPRAPLLT